MLWNESLIPIPCAQFCAIKRTDILFDMTRPSQLLMLWLHTSQMVLFGLLNHTTKMHPTLATMVTLLQE